MGVYSGLIRVEYVMKYVVVVCVFFNDTATTGIYTYSHTLSLHDALPIYAPPDRLVEDVVGGGERSRPRRRGPERPPRVPQRGKEGAADRKSTRLNSSH